MSGEHGCYRTRLAQGDLCSIELCQCGMLHVTIGALTVRLARDAATEIAHTFDQALRQLHRVDFADVRPLLVVPAGGRDPS